LTNETGRDLEKKSVHERCAPWTFFFSTRRGGSHVKRLRGSTIECRHPARPPRRRDGGRKGRPKRAAGFELSPTGQGFPEPLKPFIIGFITIMKGGGHAAHEDAPIHDPRPGRVKARAASA